MLVHNVYFTLNDTSKASIDGMVAACRKYLKNHPGVVSFSAGTLVEELARPVNDRMFHVALHIAFKDKASHDAYQTHEQHIRFIEENKANWKQARVFDSYAD
jgi:hypothetical protein